MNNKKTIVFFICFMIYFISAAVPALCPVSANNNENPLTANLADINEIDKNSEQNADDDTYQVFNVPIIMYHCIHNKNTGKYLLHPSVLEEDLIYLKEKGFNPIVIKDLIDFKEHKKSLPSKPIMLTFDDGNITNYTNAYPLMKKYGFKCVMAVVGAYVDTNYDDNGNKIRSSASSVSYEHLAEMSKSGLVEIQSHTYDMHKLNPRRGLAKKQGESEEEYEKILTYDLMRFQRQVYEKAGITSTAVAYPFGSYSKSTAEILKKAGFKAAFTCSEGINYITEKSDLFLLKRYNRPSGISTESFFDRFNKPQPANANPV